MAEYIDREAAIKEILEMYEREFPTASGAFDEFVTRLVPQALKSLPTTYVAPVVHGRWEIVIGSNGKAYMVCTICRKQQTLNGVFSYCPNCGAKMDGGVDDAAD